MSVWSKIKHIAADPPPSYVFEMSEAGISYAINGRPGFEALAPGALVATPLADNLVAGDAVAAALERIAPVNGQKRRRPAAIILPDHAARVSLLDFDALPSSAEEALALVRFRMKKSIPFDLEAASVSYWVQPATSGRKKVDVVAVTVALEILARYEALFRNAFFHPGEVTTSSLAALELFRESGVAVMARLAGKVLTVVAVADGRVRLFRCLELEDVSDYELLSVLQPTFAFVEDELGRQVGKLVVCGLPRVPDSLRVEVQPLRSRLAAVDGYNAGLLGYLEAAQN
jgi:type IV pilus assembly protein PilM